MEDNRVPVEGGINLPPLEVDVICYRLWQPPIIAGRFRDEADGQVTWRCYDMPDKDITENITHWEYLPMHMVKSD